MCDSYQAMLKRAKEPAPKAEALTGILSGLRLAAYAPGPADFALGPEAYAEWARIASEAGAPVLRALGDRVDLLVVGSRSYGPLKRTVLGSTALDLQREVRCPLLVVPRSSLGPDGEPAGESTAGAAGA